MDFKKIITHICNVIWVKVEDGIYLHDYYKKCLKVIFSNASITMLFLFFKNLLEGNFVFNNLIKIVILIYITIVFCNIIYNCAKRQKNIALAISWLVGFLPITVYWFPQISPPVIIVAVTLWLFVLYIGVESSSRLSEDLSIKSRCFKENLRNRNKERFQQLLFVIIFYVIVGLLYWFVSDFSVEVFQIFSVTTSFFSFFLSADTLISLMGINSDDVKDQKKGQVNTKLNRFKLCYFLFLFAMACINYLSLPDFIKNNSLVKMLPFGLRKVIVFFIFIILYYIAYKIFSPKVKKLFFTTDRILFLRCFYVVHQTNVSDLKELSELKETVDKKAQDLEQINQVLKNGFINFKKIKVISYKTTKTKF
ncbi:hypothetical protein R4Y45_07300 [Holzapfeliella sp. He02]|uniref:Uncharacterized protein n=1 Tax=Holzapfeliella saturejae TaxID=3082953 RepID=A0ABU8SI15_9LACO